MILRRLKQIVGGQVSHLFDAEGDQVAVTLEPLFYGAPKLPPGIYRCVRGIHRLHNKEAKPFETFEITGVPGHTGILFHVGNFIHDSDGCVLLGRVVSSTETEPVMVTDSVKTFTRFMLDQEGVESFPLTVEDGILV